MNITEEELRQIIREAIALVMEEEEFQKKMKKGHKKAKRFLISLGGGKTTPGTKKMSAERAESAPPGVLQDE